MLGRRMQRCWPPDRKIKSYSIITFQNIYTNKRGLWYFHDTFWKKKKIFFLPLLGLILTYWISVSLTYPRYHCVWLKICKKNIVLVPMCCLPWVREKANQAQTSTVTRPSTEQVSKKNLWLGLHRKRKREGKKWEKSQASMRQIFSILQKGVKLISKW